MGIGFRCSVLTGLSSANGAAPFARGIYGPFNGWFTTVTSIVFDEHGNLFVADFYNDRVQKFTANGTFLTSFGDKGTGPGQFDHAIAIAVAEDGAVFVATSSTTAFRSGGQNGERDHDPPAQANTPIPRTRPYREMAASKNRLTLHQGAGCRFHL